MTNKVYFVGLVAIVFILISGAFLYFSQYGLSFFKNAQIKIPSTTSAGDHEEIPSVWLWINNTEVVNENGTYFLTGNLGKKNNLKVKIFLGSETTQLGYGTASEFTSYDKDFPERFPNWEIGTVAQVESGSARSEFAIIKIHVDPIPLITDCDASCQSLINKQAELLENNRMLTNLDERAKLENLEVGPAIQVIQII